MVDSEKILAEWALNSGLDLESYWSADDAGKRELIANLARSHYLKGKTENYIKQVDRLWSDINPIVNTRAEAVAVEPRLARVEALVGATNTRAELARSREALGEIPRERLTDRERIARYERIEGSLNTIESVIVNLEEEIGMLGRAPPVTTDESRNVNALLREARAQGITQAGGREIATSNVRYRSGVSPREFSIREYPIGRYDERSGEWSEGPTFRVYNDEGKLLGTFDHKPSASEIKSKWRG